MTNAEDILKSLIASGILDSRTIAQQEEMVNNKRKEEEVLRIHKTPITQWADGRWHTYVKVDGKRHHKHKATREELISYLHDWYKLSASQTLEDLYSEWLEQKKLETQRPTYITRIDSDWRRLYGDIKNIPLEKLDTQTLKRWALRIIKKHELTYKAYNNGMVIMRGLMKMALSENLIPSDPFSKVEIASAAFEREIKKPAFKQVYSPAEVRQFEAVAWEDYRNTGKKVYKLAPLAALFSFYVGTRVGETSGLRFSDIEENEIVIHRFIEKDSHAVVPHAKTAAGTDRRIPLTERAKAIIAEARKMPHEDDWIFSEYKRPLPSRKIEELYEDYNLRINTAQKAPHCSRKTYASALIDGGVNLDTVRRLMGHADERTTLHSYLYDRRERAERLAVVEKALKFE